MSLLLGLVLAAFHAGLTPQWRLVTVQELQRLHEMSVPLSPGAETGPQRAVEANALDAPASPLPEEEAGVLQTDLSTLPVDLKAEPELFSLQQ